MRYGLWSFRAFRGEYHMAEELGQRCLQEADGLLQIRRLQGKNEEARSLLAQTYEWFTEGFDLPGLQRAKSLLQEWERTRKAAV